MCGIGGCLGSEASSNLIRRMSRLVKHRGPDDYGEFVDEGVALFNDRLSIIDVEGGRQPIFNEDGDVVVVYNGEIYNFPTLRLDLERRGHRFKTRSDTEVIVHGYEEFGAQVFTRLNGMFAVALWDRSLKKLLLARDRVGVKPLYYANVNGDVVFCSEVKGILSHPAATPQVDRYALYTTISLNYTPFEQTLFKGVYKLQPGHYYDSKHGVVKYWSPPPVDSTVEPDVNMVRRVVEESVKRQLISDVPVGSFLSGGLDTSTVVAFASKHYEGRLKTFCMGFGHEDDEIDDAKLVAEHFNTEHHSFTLSDQAALELYPKMIWHSEQPKLNTYSWFVNEFASKHVKVCLSGLGGDELFFGYPTSTRFVNFQRAQRLMNLPSAPILRLFTRGRRRQVLSKIKNRSDTYLSIISSVYGSEENVFTFPEDEAQRHRETLTEKMRQAFFQDKLRFTQQAVNAEFFTKMPDDYLSIDDSMSMAHSLEIRVPLLDNEILYLMLPLPYTRNYEGGVGKKILRQAMRGILPQRCFDKPKHGFSLNILRWWRGEMGEEIRRVLPESRSVREFFNVNKLNQMIPEAGESYSEVSLLWRIYAFHIWHNIFIEQGGQQYV